MKEISLSGYATDPTYSLKLKRIIKENNLTQYEYKISRSFYVDVRELHNNICGGDPQTAPRVISITLDKKSGKIIN